MPESKRLRACRCRNRRPCRTWRSAPRRFWSASTARSGTTRPAIAQNARTVPSTSRRRNRPAAASQWEGNRHRWFRRWCTPSPKQCRMRRPRLRRRWLPWSPRCTSTPRHRRAASLHPASPPQARSMSPGHRVVRDRPAGAATRRPTRHRQECRRAGSSRHLRPRASRTSPWTRR